MAKDAVLLRNTDHFINGQGAAKTARDAAKAAKQARKVAFEGETFAGLNQNQRDELLKTLAIDAGLIDE